MLTHHMLHALKMSQSAYTMCSVLEGMTSVGNCYDAERVLCEAGSCMRPTGMAAAIRTQGESSIPLDSGSDDGLVDLGRWTWVTDKAYLCLWLIAVFSSLLALPPTF